MFLKEDIPTATMGSVIIVHKSLNPDVVYEITKIICENYQQLPNIHKSMDVFQPGRPGRICLRPFIQELSGTTKRKVI